MRSVDKVTIILCAVVFISWGLSVFFDKLAAARMGNRGFVIYVITSLPCLLALFFFYWYAHSTGRFDTIGILWITASSIVNIIGLAAYYIIFIKAEASWAVAVTALYPILTIALAFIFLHETITLTKIIGITLAMIALVFLAL